MKLGMHLHELWRLRVGLVVSLVLALLVSISTAYKVSLSGIQPRSMGMASASTHVLVDSPRSVLLNLGLGADQLTQMANRALLLGNVMASQPVRQYIARRAGVPAQLIQISSPITPQYPRPLVDDNPATRRTTSDLFKSNDEYRINIKSNPTVPILDIYTEASTLAMAKALANAAVTGLNDYLNALGGGEGIPSGREVRLEQLGGTQGGAVTGSLNLEVALLAFAFVFGLASVACLVLARVVRGWRLAQNTQGLNTVGMDAGGRLQLAELLEQARADATVSGTSVPEPGARAGRA